MLAHSFLIESSPELLVTRIGIKFRASGFHGPFMCFFKMRFDLVTLDSGERLLPFGLLVINLYRNSIIDSEQMQHYMLSSLGLQRMPRSLSGGTMHQ